MNVVQKIKIRIYNLYNRKYDYYYLKSCMESIDESVDTIVAGSSYACFGYNHADNQRCIGLPSQDLYYSASLLKNILETTDNNINKVVLILGYFSMYADLSQTKNISERQRITDVYVPILNDYHNYQNSNSETSSLKSNITDIFDKLILFIMKRICFSKPITKYFSSRHTRINRRITSWENKQLSWQELDNQDKAYACQQRANGHERQLKYDGTYTENLKIMREFYNLLNSNEIALYAVIAPFPKDYVKQMSQDWVDKVSTASEYLKNHSDLFVDFNSTEELSNIVQLPLEDVIFTDKDFVDADHLGDNGASKFTAILNRILTLTP